MDHPPLLNSDRHDGNKPVRPSAACSARARQRKSLQPWLEGTRGPGVAPHAQGPASIDSNAGVGRPCGIPMLPAWPLSIASRKAVSHLARSWEVRHERTRVARSWEGEAPAEPARRAGLRLGGSLALPESRSPIWPRVFGSAGASPSRSHEALFGRGSSARREPRPPGASAAASAGPLKVGGVGRPSPPAAGDFQGRLGVRAIRSLRM